MGHPINEIEDRQGWMDFGRQAILIYRGALEEGASLDEAFKMVVAFYAGMFAPLKDDDDESSD